MFIEIEPNSPIAIYTQLISQIKKAIIRKDIGPGEMLPSVRVLAGDLGVNMHTVNKAYNHLVDEGILVKSQQGYTIKISKETPAEVENEMKQSIDELLVDVFIHDIPAEKVQEWMRETANDLKREWI